MFQHATSFNSDLASWDVSNGEYFDFMFNYASKFNSDIGGWDVSKGKSFEGMFEYASDFDQNLCGWDMSVTSEKDRFCGEGSSSESSSDEGASRRLSAGSSCFPSGGCRELLI